MSLPLPAFLKERIKIVEREQNPLEESFLKNDFKKAEKIKKKQIQININGNEFIFPFDTNKQFDVVKYNFKFAVAIRYTNEKVLFVNKGFDLSVMDDSRAYRTFYKGLMKEPFRFVYSFEEDVLIHTDDGLIIRATIK